MEAIRERGEKGRKRTFETERGGGGRVKERLKMDTASVVSRRRG